MVRFRLPLALATLLALAVFSVVGAVPAQAHGIIVTDGGDVIIIEGPGRRPHPRPTPRNPVRLKGHRVEAVLKDRVADVTVEQVFHNDSNRQLEGTYLFPLPEGASVSRFAMTMGGRMVEGEIMEAEQARRIYTDIVRRRKDPGLLEYLGRGLFRARVFPIEPHKDLTIRLSFQQIVPENDGTMEFRYPLATSRLHGDPVESVVLSVKVESEADIKAIYSPSHEVAVVRDGERRADVSYERSGLKQENDFLLYIGRSPEDVGFTFLSHKAAGEDGTFLAVIAPSTDVPEDQLAPKDVVYVLDTSGSMAENDKIGQAKKALEYGVRVLRPGDRFNIVGFAGQVRPFRDTLMPVDDAIKASASTWIQGLRAAGGTNIEGALETALAMGDPDSDRLRMVVFITDGRPTLGNRNTEDLVKVATEKNPGRARVFTFGVGFDLDVQLLDKIAAATNASRDYLMPEEDLEIVTSRFFRKVSQPVLTDVKVELGSGVHDVYPSNIGDLFAGGQVVLMGRYAESGHRVIRLKGKMNGSEVVHEYEGVFADTERAGYLPRLWAHRKVAYLLDEIRLNGEDKELIDEIVRLATKFAIVTPYTAGLVVEESEMLDGAVARSAEARAEDLAGLLPGRRGRLDGHLRAPSTPSPAARPGLGGGSGGGPASGPAGDPAAEPPAAGAPAPEVDARDSDLLERLKDSAGRGWDEDDRGADFFGLEGLRERIRTAGDKVFLLTRDGRWMDTTYDPDRETTKVEAYSDAWTELLGRSKKVSLYLAMGERVVFVLGDVAYEITPAEAD